MRPALARGAAGYGDFNYAVASTYDGEGRLTLEEWDDGADGSFEGTTTYTYGENGKVSGWDHTGYFADQGARFTYDDQDRLLYLDSVDASGEVVSSRTRFPTIFERFT